VYVESEIFASFNKTNRQTLKISRDYSFMSVIVTQYKNYFTEQRPFVLRETFCNFVTGNTIS
jgi:hypothetical protein